MKRILMILCFALVLTGCSKKQEITPEVIELEELKGFQPDAENPDSDNDGITDEDEEKLGTNPNKADTDGDGIYDGLEIRLGLDPLNAKSDGKTKDSERTFEEEYSCDTATLTVEGNYATADIVFQQSEGYSMFPLQSLLYTKSTWKTRNLNRQQSSLTTILITDSMWAYISILMTAATSLSRRERRSRLSIFPDIS